MSTPRLPNQKTQYKKLNERLSRYVASVLSIYESLSKEAAGIALTTDYDGESEFSFKDYPITRDRIQKLQQQFVSDLGGLIYAGTSDEWKRSNLLQDMIADKVLGKYVGEHKGKKYEHYYQKNSGALKAFQQRKDRGLNLSDKLWNQSKDLKTSLEETLSVSIEKGIDAVTLSKRISKYLLDFPSMQATYEEKFGHASKAKDCEYRSIRLARSEINMAYRTAEQERWRQFDFVVGYEIKLSGSHPAEDVCDRLAGKYPKDFVWSGWHPNCYTDEAKVLTADGWKYFRDVKDTDLIFSLNPQTRDVEWTSIVARQCYQYNGEVVRFYNKSLECVVTPDHNMVYIHKYGKDIRKISAKDFRMTLGAFYRTCEHNEAKERDTINIGGEIWNFDDYCEFMGYWLADGSVAHTSTITLCQKCGEPAWDGIISCINRLGYKSFIKKDRIEFNRAPIVRYLRQFGRCNEKYIPTEILSASKRQILLFLNAFIKCDGYSRKTKDYIGSRGSLFHSEKEERLYFTTSDKMAGQLCQLLLMIGHRPSFSIKEPKTHVTQDGKVFNANYPCYVINECYSGTATVFNKDSLAYSGNVYDLTLEKNHIMYISYNGRCFWGSNCMDYCVPILKTEEEYFADDDIKSKNEVTDVPREFKDWCTENWNRISKAEKRGTLPYFLRDNKEYYQKELSVKKAAVLRHKNRDAKAIQAAWDNRTYLRSYAFSEKSLYNYEDYIDVVKQGKYFGVSTKEVEEYVLFAKDIKAEEYAKLIESANEKIRERQHKSETDNNPFASEAYSTERKLNAKFAEDGKEADGYLRDNAAKIWNGLTDEQKNSLYEYTYDSTDINKQLRGIAEDDSNITNLIEQITQAIDKSAYDFDMYVGREDSIDGFCKRYGIDVSQLKEMALKSDFGELIGKEATEPAFLSTTDNKFRSSNGVDLTIYMPKGTKCIYCEPFSYFGHDVNGCGKMNDGGGKDWDGISKQRIFGSEAELLLQRDTRMKVVSIKYENGVYYVEVDVVGQIKQQKK